jgi:hypothetical protein
MTHRSDADAGRTIESSPARALSMRFLMTDGFAVRCTGCEFTWNTPAMVEGLKVLGACPKCRGKLEFSDAAPEIPANADDTVAADASAAPHMVLGIPRL